MTDTGKKIAGFQGDAILLFRFNIPTRNDPSRGPGKDHKGENHHLMYAPRNLMKPQTAASAATNDRQFITNISKVLDAAFYLNATFSMHGQQEPL